MKPVYVVVVLSKQPGAPHVIGPYHDHREAGEAADAYLALPSTARGSQAFVRSLYEPHTLLAHARRHQRADPRRAARRLR